jgi:steroid 5-alpha reductase family enzyme
MCLIVSFGLQWVAFAFAYCFQTEKFYDLTGGITFLSILAVALGVAKNWGLYSLLMAGMVALWTCRLSIFLFVRVLSAGKDSRFDKIKENFWRFFVTWTLQGLWVFVTPAPALAVILTEGNP